MLDRINYIRLQIKTDNALLRCLFGVSLSLILTTSINLFTPHITPILTLMFLGKEGERPTIKKSILILIAFGLLGIIGNSIGKYLIDMPLVVLPILGLIIFWSYRLNKIPAAVRLLFLMLAVLLTFVNVQGNFLGTFVVKLLLLHLAIALAVIQFSFLLFPVSTPIQTEKQKKPLEKPKLNLDKLALNGMLVMLPVVAIFLIYNLNILPITLVFIVILGFDPFMYRSNKGKVMLIGNVLGGALGLLAYNILVIAPNYLIYILLIISIGGYFVQKIFSGQQTAAIYDLAFKTFFVVMGSVSVSDTSAASTISDRLLQLGLAILYLIVAFKTVNTLNNPFLENETA